MASPKKAQTYQQMADQLNQLIEWFESEAVDLDQAVVKYQQAMELIGRMEKHIQAAENQIKAIKAKFDQ